ncbi:hypothetical protein G3I59_32135 [Amycolatopsis rubida]|uniref:DUF222 domain-containing protein n=1 Tax=Amycolatopsis rubida TaxID=112413 RepID=A0ABX0BJ46_9PSEU|nr:MULTISPECIES: hypothetical protein [Amycolatopsis]NEC55489.1 hypothetical protein [Amycolatopsis rubida]NEC60110.1 hypothetical protein [Amycolatopsis rubida]
MDTMTWPRFTAIDGRDQPPGSDGELPHASPSPALTHDSRQGTGLPAAEHPREARVSSPPGAQSSRRAAATDVVPDFSELIGCSDEQLEELVLANLDPEAAGLWEALLVPPLLGRVRTILIATQRRVDTDLRVRRSRRNERGSKLGFDPASPYEQRYGQWRARVTVFKRLVETRLAQTRAAETDDNRQASALNKRHRNAVRRLAHAIDCHRRALGTALDPEPADRALWQILDDVTVPLGPHGIPVPVRDMLDTYWSPEQNRPNPTPNPFSAADSDRIVLQHNPPAEHRQKGTAMDTAATGDDSRNTTEPPAPWPEDLETFAEAVQPTTKPAQNTEN